MQARQFNRELKKAHGRLNKLEKQGKATTKQTNLLGGAARALAPALTVGAVVAAGKAAVELGKLGAKAEQAETALGNLSGGAQQAQRYISGVQKSTKGTISEMDIMQASINAQTLGVVENADQMARMAEIAVTLGKAQGLTATKSIEDMTTALGRQSSKILDNLGITMQASEAYERYAARIGTTADALTGQQKRQAFVTEALAKGAEVAEDLGGILEDSQTQVEQSQAAWKDLRVELGRHYSKAVADASTATGGLARNLQESLRYLREADGGFFNLSKRLTAINVALGGTNYQYEQWIGNQDRLAAASALSQGQMDDYAEMLGRQEETVHGLAQGWSEYGGAVAVVAAKTRTAGEATQPLKEGLDSVGQASSRNTQAIRDAAKALAEQAGAAADLSMNLKDATEAQIGKELIGMLDPEKLGAQDYSTAVQDIGLAFGIMDEKSIALADNLPKLADALEEGIVPAEDAAEAMGDLVADAADGVVNFGALEGKYGNVIDRTPDLIEKLQNADTKMSNFSGSASDAAGSLSGVIANAETAKKRLEDISKDWVINVTYKTSGSAPSDPNIPEFQSGGVVPGSPTQAQLAVVHGQEQIIPASAAGRGGFGGGGNVNIYMSGHTFLKDRSAIEELGNVLYKRVLQRGAMQARRRW